MKKALLLLLAVALVAPLAVRLARRSNTQVHRINQP